MGLSGFLMICGFFYKSFAILSLGKKTWESTIFICLVVCVSFSLPFRLLAFFILKVGSFFPFLLPAVVLFPTLISVVVHLLLSFMLFVFFCCLLIFFFGSFLLDFWIILVQWAFFSHCAAPLLLSPFKVPWFVCLFVFSPSICCFLLSAYWVLLWEIINKLWQRHNGDILCYSESKW